MCSSDLDIKGLPQLLTVLGGDEQPSLGVDIVLILPDHGSPPAFPALSAACLEGPVRPAPGLEGRALMRLC